MRAIALAVFLLLPVLLPLRDAGGAIYTYKDEQGRTVFVDDEHKIPAKYRDHSSVIQERRDLIPPAAEEPTDGTGATEGDRGGGAEGQEIEEPAQTLIDRETQLRARREVEMLDRQRAHQSPVMVSGNRVLVPIEVGVDNRKAHLMLLLDTGATTTVLYRQAVKDLPFAPGESINATVAGGRQVKSERVLTRYLEVGPFMMKDFPVMLITPQGSNFPFDGMLGMDFLKDHAYEVDYANELIRWKPVDR